MGLFGGERADFWIVTLILLDLKFAAANYSVPCVEEICFPNIFFSAICHSICLLVDASAIFEPQSVHGSTPTVSERVTYYDCMCYVGRWLWCWWFFGACFDWSLIVHYTYLLRRSYTRQRSHKDSFSQKIGSKKSASWSIPLQTAAIGWFFFSQDLIAQSGKNTQTTTTTDDWNYAVVRAPMLSDGIGSRCHSAKRF